MALKGTLTVAGPFGREQLDALQARFAELLGEEVVLEVRRDEGLIGGFVALIGGKVYDASVASRIRDVQRYLSADG